MTLPSKHHDKYWQAETQINFDNYERNPALIPFFRPHQLVLDIGCGDGAVGQHLIDHFSCQVIGLDFSLTALTRAQKRKLIPVTADVDVALPFASNTFDLVLFGDVIEHIYHPTTAIKEIARVLKPGSRLLISCPNMGYWRYRLHYLIHGIFPETEWIEQDLWQSQHIRFFNRHLLYQLLNQHHLRPRSFIGISRRRLDQPLLNIFPSWFGMIMLIEAIKTNN